MKAAPALARYQPARSTITWVVTLANTHSWPPLPSAVVTRLGTLEPAPKFTFEAVGGVRPARVHGEVAGAAAAGGRDVDDDADGVTGHLADAGDLERQRGAAAERARRCGCRGCAGAGPG